MRSFTKSLENFAFERILFTEEKKLRRVSDKSISKREPDTIQIPRYFIFWTQSMGCPSIDIGEGTIFFMGPTIKQLDLLLLNLMEIFRPSELHISSITWSSNTDAEMKIRSSAYIMHPV